MSNNNIYSVIRGTVLCECKYLKRKYKCFLKLDRGQPVYVISSSGRTGREIKTIKTLDFIKQTVFHIVYLLYIVYDIQTGDLRFMQNMTKGEDDIGV